MQSETRGNLWQVVYNSVSEFADDCERRPKTPTSWEKRDFTGVRNQKEAIKLAREGWGAELARTLSVAEEAVTKVQRDYEVPSFVASYEVAGCEVDVARYLDGTPENMIDYPLTPIVKAGKVITLCASICYSAAIDEEVIRKRGQAITALALALGQLGYSSEIYADFTTRGSGKTVSVRVLVKGAQDVIDAERIAYALAHPSSLRSLGFNAMRNAPSEFVDAIDYEGLGHPINPPEDLPEGTLYTPCVLSGVDIPDADVQLVRWLTDLGIIHPDED